MFRDEFRLSHFKLWHPLQKDFTDSRWFSLPLFVAIRAIILAYNFGWLIYNIYKSGAKLFIFLTNWTFTILNLYFILATTLSCIALYKDRKGHSQTEPDHGNNKDTVVEVEMGAEGNGSTSDENSNEQDALNWKHKLLWVLHIVAASGGLFVTAGYWTILVGDDVIDANNITKHALNSVFMVIDTAISSMPVHLVHWLYALLYFAVYLIFTVIYWQAGGTNIRGEPFIYGALNYNDFQPTIGGLLVVFLLIVLPFLHLFFFGITKLRDHVHKKNRAAY